METSDTSRCGAASQERAHYRRSHNQVSMCWLLSYQWNDCEGSWENEQMNKPMASVRTVREMAPVWRSRLTES